MFVKLRELTGIVHDDTGLPLGVPDGNVLGCVWCVSVWMAAVLLAMPIVVWLVLAASAIAIIVNERLVR